jgi:hypothetical protein
LPRAGESLSPAVRFHRDRVASIGFESTKLVSVPRYNESLDAESLAARDQSPLALLVLAKHGDNEPIMIVGGAERARVTSPQQAVFKLASDGTLTTL